MHLPGRGWRVLVAMGLLGLVIGGCGIVILAATFLPDWTSISVYIQKDRATEQEQYERQYGVTYPPRECAKDEFACLADNTDDGLLRRASDYPEAQALYKIACIPINWKCDGIKDCANGDDEKACCPDIGDYTCATQTNASDNTSVLEIEPLQCVSKARLCDGTSDCVHGDDEYCSAQCASDNVCIDQCDGWGLGYTCNCQDDWRLTKDGNIDCKISFNFRGAALLSVLLFAAGMGILLVAPKRHRRRALRPFKRKKSVWAEMRVPWPGHETICVEMTEIEIRAWVQNILGTFYNIKPAYRLDGDTYVSKMALPKWFAHNHVSAQTEIDKVIEDAKSKAMWRLPVPPLAKRGEHRFAFVSISRGQSVDDWSFVTIEHTNKEMPPNLGLPRDARWDTDTDVERDMYRYSYGDDEAKRPGGTDFCRVCKGYYDDREGCHCRPCRVCTLRQKIEEMDGRIISGLTEGLKKYEITDAFPNNIIVPYLYAMIKPAPSFIHDQDSRGALMCDKRVAIDYMAKLPLDPNPVVPGAYCPTCRKTATIIDTPEGGVVAGRIDCGELAENPVHAMDTIHAMYSIRQVCKAVWNTEVVWAHDGSMRNRCERGRQSLDTWKSGELARNKIAADYTTAFIRPGNGCPKPEYTSVPLTPPYGGEKGLEAGKWSNVSLSGGGEDGGLP